MLAFVMLHRIAIVFALSISLGSVQAFSGASVPWTTYEAENMATTGTVFGPQYGANVVASESSGRKCVQLNGTGQYMQFTAQAAANALVVRYSVPDTANGMGTDYTISLYTNGVFVAKLPVTSRYSRLYGAYPFTNNPSAGSPRNFYDEVRTNGLNINPGDVVRLQEDNADTAAYYLIDLVDLENVPAPITQPANSLSILSYSAGGTGATDDTTPLVNCISAASSQGKTVWLPAGTYKITSSINLPSNTTIQGAGMWYSTLVGDPVLYTNPSRRLTLNGNGSNIQLSDIAVIGKLNYRDDKEPNDGLGGSYGTGSTIARVWVEHTKTGAWLVNSSGLVVSNCRFRDTIADGINLCVGMQSTTVTNCTARGTGDDCFAIWPATYISQTFSPGLNVIRNCTGQVPFLANGGAIYGGASNRIEDCLFQDITYGCGILISTTFDVGTNDFSGTTVAQKSDLVRCGGIAGLQICLQNKGLSGLNLNNLNIANSISDGLSIIAPGSNLGTGVGTLANAVMANVSITNYGIGVSGRHGLWARSDTIGSMTVSNSTVVDYLDSSANFSFTFVTSTIPVTVQPNPSGRSFTVDGTNYSSAQIFNWVSGSSHTIATTLSQSGGTGAQYAWVSWSDGGAISHTVAPTSGTIYTASFTMQYFLTMNAGAGGTVSPANGWTDSGTAVNISATASNGYSFASWAGSGSGSYSGNINAASVMVNGPITENASFGVPSAIISLGGNLNFGNVSVGNSSNQTFTISNVGSSTLAVGSISYPAGFSGAWSGAIAAGGSTNLTATFLPVGASNYSGSLTVSSDAASGVKTLAVSGVGVAQTNGSGHQIILVDLGNNSSYRGTNVVNPDVNGHFWNSVWSGAFYANMVDLAGNPTSIGLGFDSAVGTDSYNGPSGATLDPGAVVIDAPALGNLGINAAVYDYYVSSSFQIQGLNPALTYSLTFFGSHKYNTDDVTRYAIYTDNTYSTVVASTILTVGVGSAHNSNTVATINGLLPQMGNALYVKFFGTNGGNGYLNDMQIMANHAPTAQPLTFTLPLGQTNSVQVIGGANAPTDADGDSLVVSSVSSPVLGGGSVTTNGGSGFTYAADGTAVLGTNQFTYTVTDPYGTTVTKPVTVIVYNPEGLNQLHPPSLLGGGVAVLTYMGIPGNQYALDSTTNLAAPITWTAVATNFAGSDGIVNFTNMSFAPANFFRTRSVNGP
ncbi:MAG: parallel beta-helix repeat [Pedosphaera sp.]|nr:parallel beta-helix repeat [Pedosphaera sp.]